MLCCEIAAAEKDPSLLDKVSSARLSALQERSTGMNTAEDSTLEAAVRVGFPVFFHLVMEGALWIPDFRRD